MRRLVTGLLALLLLALSTTGPRPASAAGELKIGITQFPSTFHPLIDSMLAKSYILAMTLRPVTVYDQDWQLICMLCTELPTIENGGAVPEELEGGGQGIAITYKLHPDATWGDGTPVTSDDVVFTWEFGSHPQSGVANREPYERITAIDVIDAKTFRVHVDRLKFDYAQSGRFNLLPAHSGAADLRGQSNRVPQPQLLRYRPHQSRPVLRALQDRRGRDRRPCRAGTQSDLVRTETGLRPHPRARDREHRRPRGQSAVRRPRHGGGRTRPDHRPGAGIREAPRRPLRHHLQSRFDLRAHRSEPGEKPDPAGQAGAPGAAPRPRPRGPERTALWRQATRRPLFGQPARLDPRSRTVRTYPYDPEQGGRPARRGRLVRHPRRRPPQRRRRPPVAWRSAPPPATARASWSSRSCKASGKRSVSPCRCATSRHASSLAKP